MRIGESLGITLYTPGHGLVTDSLILHGLLRVLSVVGVYDAEIERLGDRFAVKIPSEKLDLRALTEHFERSEIAESIRISANLYLKSDAMVRPLAKIFDVNPDVSRKNNRSWVQKLLKAIKYLDLSLLIDRDHKSSRKEGRAGNKDFTLYLPLSSIYGKYHGRGYRLRAEPYTVCETCFTLSSLGLIYGAYSVVVRRDRNKFSLLMTIVPRERMRASELLVLQRLLEDYEVIEREVADIPLLALPLYTLSAGETLLALDSPSEIITWKLVFAGTQRSLDIAVLQLDRIVNFITHIKTELREWPYVVHECLGDEEGFTLMADLNELINFDRSMQRAYKFARELTSYVERGRKEEDKKRACDLLYRNIRTVTNVIMQEVVLG